MHLCLIILLLSPCVMGDIYMHNPRGSNNRASETTAQRRNANRLFDSQNNNRGGYNIGDRGSNRAGGNVEKQYQMRYFQSSSESLIEHGEDGKTFLKVEWTNQHGCGSNPKVNCNLVLQYMCMPDNEAIQGRKVEGNILRDGLNTQQQGYTQPRNSNENYATWYSRVSQMAWHKGMHEPMYWYDKCRVRERNDGLFAADQNDGENNNFATVRFDGEKYVSSTSTRQNGNGNRHGYECPEERDYYPYWHPNPWKDAAVLVEDSSQCDFYESNSFNTVARHECYEGDMRSVEDGGESRQFSRWNNKKDCEDHDGTWQLFYNYLEKTYPYEHLGCFRDRGGNRRIMQAGIFINFNSLEYCDTRCRKMGFIYFGVQNGQDCWCSNDDSTFTVTSDKCTVPCRADPTQICGGPWAMNIYKVSEEEKCTDQQGPDGIDYMWEIPFGSHFNQPECLVKLQEPKCEEAPWTRTNHLGNGMDAEPTTYDWVLPYFPSGRSQVCVLRMRYNISTDDYDAANTFAGDNDVLSNNPTVDVGQNVDVNLNINTAQFGRTFQDRSHTFYLDPRPDTVADTDRIYNLNVRGKRGNIVQAFPAVEYDFVPNDITLEANTDLLHIQWTGSNTAQNNGNPGDGQAGDAGQGKSGTERHNLVQIRDASVNFPLNFVDTVFNNAPDTFVIEHDYANHDMNEEDLAIYLATSGYYECRSGCDRRPGNIPALDANLNNAPASFPGVLLRPTQATNDLFHYMSSRNNAFTNRSQKGRIRVVN